MDEKPTVGPEKKSQFDDLSREELITKCKNLLGIAKKAKAAKDESIEEIKRLKLDIESKETDRKAIQEIVEKLTEEKLANITKFDELNQQILAKENSLKELQNELKNFNEISIENEALKRRVDRLTEENDSLLAQMQSLDNKQAEENLVNLNDLKENLAKVTKQFDEKVSEVKNLQDLIEHNSHKIKTLIQDNSDLKSALDSRNDTTPIDQVKLKYEKCIKKLKLYREKIHEISDKFALLKADREVLVETTKEYHKSVSGWQTDIAKASVSIIERFQETNKQLRSKEEEIKSLKEEIENSNQSSDELKLKDEEIERIRKEFNETLKSKESILKDLEGEVEKLKEIIKEKDKTLNEEKEAQKKLKQAVRKSSVLNLEMEAYEKTLDELNKKLEAKKLEVSEFEQTIKIQNDTMESLKSQIVSLEANLESEKAHSVEVKRNLDSQQNLFRKTEHERTEANLQLELLSKDFENLKLENNEIKLEMAKHAGELEKKYQILSAERDELLKNVSHLEIELDKFKKLSSSHEKEIENLRSEFSSYKIRAQSVLRQSQTKDLSKEQELQDELQLTQKTLESLKETNEILTHEMKNLRKNCDDLGEDKTMLQNRCKELLKNMERQSDEMLEESRKRNQQHDEAIKAYQLQVDTLNAFYKKKIKEVEESNNLSVSELQGKIQKLEKVTATSVQSSVPVQSFESTLMQMRSEEQKLSLMDREEAEGSEDQSSQSSTFQTQHRRKISRNRELMPLDELLNSSIDDNSNEINEETVSNFSSPSEILEQTKAKLSKEGNRVAHLTSLLADSEKDLARMTQLNDLLKEEVRKMQRNFDREEHIKNSEYLKNIVIKFVTLNNGDEKQRLIPVLNTILKLSSEENNLLQNACKSGWSGLWSK